MTKPISPQILLKKMEVIVNRSLDGEILEYQDLRIDFEKKKLWNHDGEVRLTAREWKVISVLAANRGKIVTKERLFEKVWTAENSFVEDHALTVVINRLRKKIEKNPSDPVYIRNIFGVGYTFGE